MPTHFLIRRAAHVAVYAAVLTPSIAFGAETSTDRILPVPKARFNHDPIGKRHILERMVIDIQSATENIRLSVDMDKDDFVLYHVATPKGKVQRSEHWFSAPGQNEFVLDACTWPGGKLELSMLTRRDLMKLEFER